MKRAVVNPDPTHKKRMHEKEKIQNKELKELVTNDSELEKEMEYKTKPHKS